MVSKRRRVNDDTEFEIVPRQTQRPTLSIALPSSIIQNAQSPELQMYLAGQVARTAAIYCVTEIVIFLDNAPNSSSTRAQNFLETVLQYAETPQYLRKHLYPHTPMLRLAGLLNPLALPSHLGRSEYCRYRDGVYTRGRYVDVGLERVAEVDKPAPHGTRVTVDLSPSGDETYHKAPGKYLFGKVVPYHAPDLYWGYRVRSANSLTDVFKTSPIRYDLVIGTSERGTPLGGNELPGFHQHKHALVVFGGVNGLEHAWANDESLKELDDVGDLFDYYVNTCTHQGSRTIRTEEALLISLAALEPYLRAAASAT